MQPVRSERRGAVALLTFDRPGALNALDRATMEGLAARLDEVEADPSVRAVVLTGAGRAFVAGADIAAMRELSALEAGAFSRFGQETLARLESLDVPSIAAVNGFALGGGCELALACDWIYASREARFGQPEVKLGLVPGFGGCVRLPRRVGVGWARELILGGEPIDAELAQRIGLVNRLFEPETLVDAAVAAGEALAAQGPLAIAAAKRVMQESQDADSRTAAALEREAFAAIFASEDRHEGIAAFLEKRAAKFRGC